MQRESLIALALLVAAMNTPAQQLPPCPDRPNCVSSQAGNEDQRVEPLAFQGDAEEAMQKLTGALESLPRTRVVKRDGNLLQAESRSWLFGFVDRMDFVLNAEAGVIDCRSAAESGYYDFGVNRRRIEEIRRRLMNQSE